MSEHKKDEIPIPEEILSKYKMKGVTYRVFNYIKNGIEWHDIEVAVDYEVILEEIEKPQALELQKQNEFSYRETEKMFNSVSQDLKKMLKKRKIKATVEAKKLMTNLLFYCVRVQQNAKSIMEELFDE